MCCKATNEASWCCRVIFSRIFFTVAYLIGSFLNTMFTKQFRILCFRFLLVLSLEVDSHRPKVAGRFFRDVFLYSFLWIFSFIVKYLIVLHSFIMFCLFFGFEDVLSLSHTRRSSFSRLLFSNFPLKKETVFLSAVHYI